MEYIYAALLLHKAGKELNEGNVKKVLTAAGINVDVVRVKALMASLAEVNIEEAIKSVPTVASVPVAAQVTVPLDTEAKPKEEKKEEKDKEEAALEGLGALFG